MKLLTVILSVCSTYIPVSLSADPIVSTSSGQVRGQYLADFNANQFLGIPYAQQRRFQPPESYPSWSGIRNATEYGANCPPSQVSAQGKINEDCLFMNIYTPSSATTSSGLTVMFWIHGGSFVSGTGRNYPGLIYAKEHNIILVNINYRLGILGFFNVPGTDVKGNYGMFDQIKALKWVKDNIKNFGGDPEKVTVFGESAGSASISLLGMSPLTTGLFKQAIMESGSAVGGWAYSFPDEESPKTFAKALQCPETPKEDMLSCIKEKPFQDILTAQTGLTSNTILMPVVDNYFLTNSPRKLLESGNFHSMPIMMGTNVNEADLFLADYDPYVAGGLENGMTKDELEKYIKYNLLKEKDSVKEAVLFEYSDNDCLQNDCLLTNRKLASAFASDLFFNAPVNFEVRARSQVAPVYSYLYSYEGTTVWLKLPSWVGTTHASELEYVFGHPMLNTVNFTNDDRKVSGMIMKSWANFAKYSHPNHGDLGVTWPKFENTGANGRSYLSLKLQPVVEKLRKPHKFAFWNSYIHQLKNAETMKCSKVTTSSSYSVHSDAIFVNLVLYASVFATLFTQ